MIDILIVEDNKEIAKLLRDFLVAGGYTAKIAESGEQALALYAKEGARLLLLDIMLPGMDGYAVCKKILEKENTPILILSAKTEKEDKLNGLLLGADDYIEKPYDIDILMAKIQGIFRRRYEQTALSSGNLILDKARRTVQKDGEPLSLSVKEYELLLYFLENPNKTLSKDVLFNKIWGFDSFSEPQTLTVHIKWLREKIEEDAKHPIRIVTVWGIGYRFDG